METFPLLDVNFHRGRRFERSVRATLEQSIPMREGEKVSEFFFHIFTYLIGLRGHLLQIKFSCQN
jgi:hypothetical protein